MFSLDYSKHIKKAESFMIPKDEERCRLCGAKNKQSQGQSEGQSEGQSLDLIRKTIRKIF